MKPTKVLTYIVIAAVILIAVFSLFDSGESPEVESNYIEEIKAFRHEKDSFMRNDEKSPFLEQNVAFKGLNYFDVDES